MFNKSVLIFFGVLLFSLKIHATTFQVMPLEKLVEESGSAAEVELKEKKSYMTKMGLIMTDYVFKVGESYNVENSDLDGEFLKITLTGGTVNGVTSFIDGAPEFSVGEKSFLLLKRIESKMYISNFTMGKYKIEDRDGKIFYVSTVFPYDADIGQVPKDRMIDMIKLKFKTSEAEKKETKSVASMWIPHKPVVREFEKRAPAQEAISDEPAQDGTVAMWSFFGLMMTSGFVIWWKLRKGVRV